MILAYCSFCLCTIYIALDLVWNGALSFYSWSRFPPTSYLPLPPAYPPTPTPTYPATPTSCLPLPPTTYQPYQPIHPYHLPTPTQLPLPPTYPPTYPYPLPTPTSYLPSPPTYPYPLPLTTFKSQTTPYPTPTCSPPFIILSHISHYLYLSLPLPSLTICFLLYFNCLHLILWPLKPFWSPDLSSSSSSPFLTFPINTVISLHCIFSTITFMKLFMILSPILLISPLFFGMGNSKGDGKPLNPPRPCVDFKHKSCLVHSPGLLIHG